MYRATSAYGPSTSCYITFLSKIKTFPTRPIITATNIETVPFYEVGKAMSV